MKMKNETEQKKSKKINNKKQVIKRSSSFAKYSKSNANSFRRGS